MHFGSLDITLLKENQTRNIITAPLLLGKFAQIRHEFFVLNQFTTVYNIHCVARMVYYYITVYLMNLETRVFFLAAESLS